MKLTAEQVKQNWENLIFLINETFDGERLTKLLAMYDHFQDRMMLAPASSKEHYHYAFAGGYVLHVLHVVELAKKTYDLWKSNGASIDLSEEELVFSALHHDLGKIGDVNNDYYIPQESEWHRINQGAIYKPNPDIQYMSIPDRSVWLLNYFGLKMSQNEWLGIQLSDGLYNESNQAYLKSYSYEFRMRSNLPYIIHQADILAMRVELNEWQREQSGEGDEYHTQPAIDKPVNSSPLSSAKKIGTPLSKSDVDDMFKNLFGEKQ